MVNAAHCRGRISSGMFTADQLFSSRMLISRPNDKPTQMKGSCPQATQMVGVLAIFAGFEFGMRFVRRSAYMSF